AAAPSDGLRRNRSGAKEYISAGPACPVGIRLLRSGAVPCPNRLKAGSSQDWLPNHLCRDSTACATDQCATSVTSLASSVSRNWQVLLRSKSGSVDSMQRKKRLRDASAN